MFVNDVKIRVRYAETDKMGYVYYGNYATYFEVARVESLRNLGFSYRALEESGIMLPVLDYHSKFIKPAMYDDELTIRTYIKEIPFARIKFEYDVFNPVGELINVAQTTLVFVKSDTKRPCHAPGSLLDILKEHFT